MKYHGYRAFIVVFGLISFQGCATGSRSPAQVAASNDPIVFHPTDGFSPLSELYECTPGDPSNSFKAQIWNTTQFGDNPLTVGVLIDNASGRVWSVNPVTKKRTPTQDQYLANSFEVIGYLNARTCANGVCTWNAIFYGAIPSRTGGFGDYPIPVICKGSEFSAP